MAETEKQDEKNPDVYHIEATDLHMIPKACPVCREPLISKGIAPKVIYDYCSIPYTGKEKHIYKISVKRRRYECKNKKEKHTFTAGISDRKS
ncbi:MAG: hypothetical protein IJO13_00635, partial [Lachnospiraceae bacterium]|nr:hypothetical protein [Lachnospiraceae bacterium]